MKYGLTFEKCDTLSPYYRQWQNGYFHTSFINECPTSYIKECPTLCTKECPILYTRECPILCIKECLHIYLCTKGKYPMFLVNLQKSANMLKSARSA